MRESFADVSDAALVLAIARYRQEALAEAYRRHAGAVFGLARRLLSEQALAEEIVQEVFLRLWNDPDRFDPVRGTLRSYLLAHTHGRAVDLLRSEGARRTREERDARRTAEGGYDVEHEVWDLATADQVRQSMDRLPPRSGWRSSWPTSAATRTGRWPPARRAGGHDQEPDPQRAQAAARRAGRGRHDGGRGVTT